MIRTTSSTAAVFMPARPSVARRAIGPLALALLLGLALATPAIPATATAARLMVLVDAGPSVAIESIALGEGEEVVLARPEIITVLLPYGIGQSGDLVQRARRSGEIRAQVTDGELRVRMRQPDGSFRALPPVPVADLASYEMRVNVTGAGGVKKALRIRGYETVVEDGGPVTDMFGGRIPLGPGDFAVTTEVTKPTERPLLAGRIPVTFRDGLIFTDAVNSEGRKGRFVVDLGAGRTVVTRGFLPPGVEVRPIEGVEHSEKGARRVAGTMGAAGGDVASLLGAAAAGPLRLGELTVTDLQVNVVEAIPELGGGPVAGILGVDVLANTSRLRLERRSERAGVLIFESSQAPVAQPTEVPQVEMPFTWVAKHILLDARFGSVPVSLVLDTGARGSLIPSALARSAGLPPAPGEGRVFRGLDGRPLESTPVLVEELRLGVATVPDIVFHATDLTVLDRMGLGANAGLLGNDVLSRYRELEVDFVRRLVRLRGRG